MGPTYNRCKNGCDDVKTVSVHLGRAAKEGGTQHTSDNTAMLEIAVLVTSLILFSILTILFPSNSTQLMKMKLSNPASHLYNLAKSASHSPISLKPSMVNTGHSEMNS
jgi:hypothetical protein